MTWYYDKAEEAATVAEKQRYDAQYNALKARQKSTTDRFERHRLLLEVEKLESPRWDWQYPAPANTFDRVFKLAVWNLRLHQFTEEEMAFLSQFWQRYIPLASMDLVNRWLQYWTDDRDVYDRGFVRGRCLEFENKFLEYRADMLCTQWAHGALRTGDDDVLVVPVDSLPQDTVADLTQILRNQQRCQGKTPNSRQVQNPNCPESPWIPAIAMRRSITG